MLLPPQMRRRSYAIGSSRMGCAGGSQRSSTVACAHGCSRCSWRAASTSRRISLAAPPSRCRRARSRRSWQTR
eukprot:7386582-Prymnesium_polylepis.1